MKKLLRTLIAMALVVALTLTASVPAAAARPSTKFLSELHMAEADDAETAKKMLTDKGFTVFNKNLNPGSDKVVYLGYKTSSNVEDAITDISVMNMKGGYNITDYEAILEESLEEYRLMVTNFRIAANEFAANYKAGSKEAALAYRQLNYYYVEENDKKTKMGDYMLAFPENDEDFANILFKGNVNILGNIRTLLAMGSGDVNESLTSKIAKITNDPTVYEKAEYHEDAKTVYQTIISIEKDIDGALADIDEINADETLTDEEKEEYITAIQNSSAKFVAFKTIIDNLTLKDTTYGEYLKENPQITDYSIFYPILDAMTAGQRALVPFGQLISIFVYDSIEKDDAELEAELAALEEDFDAVSVFLGTDMEIFEGSFAVTSDALRAEATTGKSWTGAMTTSEFASDIATSIFMGVAGAGIMAVSASFLKDAVEIVMYPSMVAKANTLQNTVEFFQEQMQVYYNYGSVSMDSTVVAATNQELRFMNRIVNGTKAEYSNVQTSINSTQHAAGTSQVGTIIGSSLGLVLGAAIIGFSIYSIVQIVNSYNAKYTDIPTNMVDCVDTENGDRYIRYSVVNSYYESDGQVKSRAGDTNAYTGDQWNAIYYTKNYEAGKCMLASADWPTAESDYGKYSPVTYFGEEVCYNLNKYGVDENAKIFLAFQTSNAKKAAEAEVPSVVGSVFTGGAVAISGIGGLCIGMGIMGLIKRKKKEENVDEKNS